MTRVGARRRPSLYLVRVRYINEFKELHTKLTWRRIIKPKKDPLHSYSINVMFGAIGL